MYYGEILSIDINGDHFELVVFFMCIMVVGTVFSMKRWFVGFKILLGEAKIFLQGWI